MSDVRALILTIIGTGLAVTTIVITVLSMQIAAVNTRIDGVERSVNARIDDLRDELRADIRDLRADHVRFEQRLDALEVAVGRLEQRVATLERVLLPAREPAGE